jgi:GNAT superfamily N-acetyltransferase
MNIEVHDGKEGWALAEALDSVCYPPEVMATVIWRDVTWAQADKRIFARLNGETVCHAGLYLREAKDGTREVRVGGIGGVMTLPEARRHGCAGEVLRAAAEVMKGEGCDFGLLFCETHNVAFYERLGWRKFRGEVFCEQPTGRVRFDIMHTMVLPVSSEPQSSAIDLCGLPW